MAKKTTASAQIDDYIENLPEWSKKLCTQLRTLIHRTDPSVVEVVKWGGPAFEANGAIAFLVWAFKKHVNLTFYQGALIPDRHHLFNAGDTNLRSRSVKFGDSAEIDEKKLHYYFKEAIELNKKGRRVKIPVTKDKTVIIPPSIKKILKKESLLEKYNEQIYTYRKGYVQWIEEARQEETKKKRIGIMLSELREGKEYMGMKR